jgi:hypothetical protein
VIVLDLIGDLPRNSPIDASGIPKQQGKQKATKPVTQRSLRTIEPQQAPLEHTSPSVLLWARHLHDTEPAIETCLNNFPNGAGSASSAKISRILVKETMREKHDLPASLID